MTPMTEEEDLRIGSEVRSEGAHPLYGALSWRGLDPTKLAYNPSRSGDQLKLKASAFNRLQTVCQAEIGNLLDLIRSNYN